jgi:diaminopimelate decarboxylase
MSTSEGHLIFDGCDTVELAREYGTPLYVVSEATIRARIAEIKSAFLEKRPGSRAAFASKAFQTLDMCRIAASEGLYLDVVSGGEIHAALRAGFDPARMYFHGNAKTERELHMALELGVGRVVVDNLDELRALNGIALGIGKRQPILFRITPGVDSHTHQYIDTGRIDSKFGIPLDPSVRGEYIGAALGMGGVELKGFHFHVGSQLLENDSHLKAVAIAIGFIAEVKRDFGFEATELNLGGGFGVRYTEADRPKGLAYYTDAMCDAVDALCREKCLAVPSLAIEPGRWIVGEAGITLYGVASVKEIPGIRSYVAVDGGMTDNPRPALYGAKYEAVLANKQGLPAAGKYTIAGKCCETGDIIARDIALPAPEPGDILAVFATGAYNYTMASNYNRTPRPALVMTNAGKRRLSVRRESYDDLIAREI